MLARPTDFAVSLVDDPGRWCWRTWI